MEENKNINIQNNQPKNQEKNERNGRGLFYFVIAFAVIIIAVVGATYAYFTATARSDESNAVTAGSTEVALGIEIDRSGANTNLIPASDIIAKYAYAEKKEIIYTDECIEYAVNEDGSQVGECMKYKKDPRSTCLDDYGAEVCSTYTYTIISSASQTLKMFLGTNNNQFGNLWFAVYTDTGTDTDGKPIRTRISDPKPVAKEGNQEVEITPRVIEGEDKEEENQYFYDLAYPKLDANNQRKTYTIVLWIKELDGGESDTNTEDNDQTDADGRGKTFTGYVRVSSEQGGVTGQIGGATDDTDFTLPTSETTSEPEDNEDENLTTEVTTETEPGE